MDTLSRAYLGDPDPAWHSLVWGFLDISGSCEQDAEIQALTIRNSNGSPVTTKSFSIPDSLYFDLDGPSLTSFNSTGVTVGVTGAAPIRAFNAALWGLTTIADSNITPPPTQAPTTPPPTTPTSVPSINSSAAAVTKSASNLDKSIRFSTSSKVLTQAHKNTLKKSFKASGRDATYVVTGNAGFLPGVTEAQVKKLARVRANIVRDYLVKLGVNRANITIKITTTNRGIVPKTKTLARVITS
jgi:outer membrane protein OmpA-like peptidoglycan-associated protein